MQIIKLAAAYIAAVITAYTAAAGFYTQQVLAKQAEIGAIYTPSQQAQTYFENFIGLVPAYGLMVAIALLVGFVVAAGVKRIVVPLAPIAYPLAGAAAMWTLIWAIETFVAGGGVGAIGGARDALGVGLQMLAGAAGGAVFEWLRPRR
ncbi:MAG: hypothetical protein GXP06_06200 [Alphaproteobacteria bacterium]|nr:hypothetical protein [Alphaproteobacteria bacterium]